VGDVYPGGRFDPFNYGTLQNIDELKMKELKHCRLAMFAWLGRGVIENQHSTDVESPPPPPRICMSIHPEVSR